MSPPTFIDLVHTEAFDRDAAALLGPRAPMDLAPVEFQIAQIGAAPAASEVVSPSARRRAFRTASGQNVSVVYAVGHQSTELLTLSKIEEPSELELILRLSILAHMLVVWAGRIQEPQARQRALVAANALSRRGHAAANGED